MATSASDQNGHGERGAHAPSRAPHTETDRAGDGSRRPGPPPGTSTRRRVHLGDCELAFDAIADWTQLRKGDDDEPAAEIFHVAYLSAAEEDAQRPVTFVFNGGPGASSAYLHMGALGPRRVVFDDGGRVPPPPVRVVDNRETWLRFTDLVFVDPVGTGFSRPSASGAAPSAEGGAGAASGGGAGGPGAQGRGSEFYGLSRDLDSLGEFIQRFLSAHHRWTSPVFVAGESYGGFRAGVLARKLQEGFGVGLNGAVLISPALEFAHLVPSDYDVLHFVDAFPTMAAAAHAHGRQSALSPDAPLAEVLEAAEEFAARELADVLIRGERAEASRRDEVYRRAAALSGLPRERIATAGGRIRARHFARELLRDRGEVCGLYDATVTARDPYPDRDAGEGPDPTLFAIERAFSAGVNAHLRSDLGVDTERLYRLLSMEVNRAWYVDGDAHMLEKHHIGATDDLRYALALNPHMRVLVSHGLYDLVTPYAASERILGHMKLDGGARERVTSQHFPGGHMFYTVDESRRAFRDAGARFVAEAAGAAGE